MLPKQRLLYCDASGRGHIIKLTLPNEARTACNHKLLFEGEQLAHCLDRTGLEAYIAEVIGIADNDRRDGVVASCTDGVDVKLHEQIASLNLVAGCAVRDVVCTLEHYGVKANMNQQFHAVRGVERDCMTGFEHHGNRCINRSDHTANRRLDRAALTEDALREGRQIMGRTLTESIMLLDKQCIVGIVRKKVMDFYGLTPGDMDGIVSQLKNTEGVHVAIFLYELEPQVFKVSLRSDELVDVSKIAAVFGGGGHIRAAGCTMSGSPYDVINNLTLYIEKQLLAEEEEETTEEEA